MPIPFFFRLKSHHIFASLSNALKRKQMKTIIRKSVFTALMLGTLSSYAIGITLLEKKRTEVKTNLINVKKGQRIYIKNSAGKVLHEKTIARNGTYEKAFDFTSLQNGYYLLEVNKDFQIEVIPFTVVANKATFYPKEEKTIFKPVVRVQNNKVLVSKLEHESTPMRVTIYFEKDVILMDTIKGETVLQRVYKLRDDIKGNYKVVIKANSRTYINKFSL